MERRAHRHVWLVAVLVALLANQAFAAVGARYFVCTGDQVARLQCCCPEMSATARPEEAAQITAPCCCQVTRAGAPTGPALAPAASEARVPAKVFLGSLATLHVVFLSPPQVVFSTYQAQPPPPAPVTILLQKQSFLI